MGQHMFLTSYMAMRSLFPATHDPAPAFECSNLRHRGTAARYRVPVSHLRMKGDRGSAKKFFRNLPELGTIKQLRTLVGDGGEFGLFSPIKLQEQLRGSTPQERQAIAGAVRVLSPHDWEAYKAELRQWFGTDVESEFAGLPYRFEDILVVATLNFSPDRWFIVLRGEMAGAVCWWTHDGDSTMHEPWASDLRAWGTRLWAELPTVLGGVIRYGANASVDPVEDDAELYPEKYLADFRKP